MNKMKLLNTILCMLFSIALHAQTKTISGQVSDDSGPLPGLSILIKGTTIGTQTDFDGNFSIDASIGDILQFRYIGMETQELTVGKDTTINVTMKYNANSLDEVVIVGYGSQRKSDLTGSIGSLDGDAMVKFQSGDATKALQGTMAGVRIEANGGSPGASANIVIRGVSSLSNSNPLYVIDGMFTDDMSFINPSDIKSIQVLKDASAAAIYGSRAANGVVVVTTLDGSGIDGLRVDVDMSSGVDHLIKGLDWLSGQEYAGLRNVLSDANGQPRLSGFNSDFDPSVNTIVEDLAISSGAAINNLSVKAYGSSGLVNFNISANSYDQEGMVLASGFKRKTFRANTSIKKGRLQISQSFTYSRSKNQVNTIWNLPNNILPTIPFRNPDNEGGFGAARDDSHGMEGVNSIGKSMLWDRHRTTDNLLGNLSIKYRIADGLFFKLNTGIQYKNYLDYTFTPTYFMSTRMGGNQPKAELRKFRDLFTSNLIEGTLNYAKSFKDHSLDIIVGATQQKDILETSGVIALGFPNNNIRQVGASETIATAGGLKFVSTLRSFLGRINYNYKRKYFLSATVRQDGSSRFSEDNRWGTFPSISGAWTVSKESFLEGSNLINNLKVRASYGELGSQNVQDYAYIPTLNINSDATFGFGQTRIPGVSQTNFSNPNIVWETTKMFNIGLDIGLFENKLAFTMDYFDKKSEDILVNLQIPLSSGTSVPVPQNAAAVQNTGLELALMYNGSSGDFNYDFGGNITFLSNKVLDLGENVAPISGGQYNESRSTLTEAGHPVASFYGHQVIGIYQSQSEIENDGNNADPNAEPGDFRYADLDGDGVLTDDDRKHLGSYAPEFEYGFTFNATYKNFDINMMFNGVYGNEIYNVQRRDNLLNLTSNMTREALNYWRPDNTDTGIPRIGGGADNARPSSFYIESGAYFRLRNLQIGYSIPLAEKIKVRKLRVYGSVQNLFTISNFSGYYPEIGRSQDNEMADVENTNTLFYAGVNQSAYPTPRTIILGLQIGF
jgi:TonB-linked SusC/RagA family outer membrane protein